MTEPSQSVLDGRDEHEIFVRKARDASHQALFFLGLVHKTSCDAVTQVVRRYGEFASRQVDRLVAGIVPPEVADESKLKGDERKERRSWKNVLEWRARPGKDLLDELHRRRKRFTIFLDASRPKDNPEHCAQQLLTDVMRFLHKRLTQLIALAVVGFVLFGVEAVHSLWRNAGWGALLPASIVLIPMVVTRGWILLQHRRAPGVVHWWDIGGPPFRSFLHMAIEPGRSVRRWPDVPRKMKLFAALRSWAGRLLRPQSMLDAILSGQLLRLGGYILAWITVILVVLYVPLVPVAWGTLVLIFSFLYAILIVAYCFDFWEFLDPQPVRPLALLAGLVLTLLILLGIEPLVLTGLLLIAAIAYGVAFFRRTDRPFRLVISLVLFVVTGLSVYGSRVNENETWPEDGWESFAPLDESRWPYPGDAPVVVMAASGGGSRAAIFTGLTLASLHEDKELEDVSSNLHAISSVSGGSLANAVYVTQRFEKDSIRRDRMVADLAKDFLKPTIVGALNPKVSRGAAIESFWKEELGLGEVTLGDLAEGWRGATSTATPPFPIPLFNSSTLDAHNVVLSPLSSELYTLPELRPSTVESSNLYDESRRRYFAKPGERSTWVYYRDGIYGLEDLVDANDVPLNKVVRASANFPFGFPLVRVRVEETETRLFMSPAWAFPRSLSWLSRLFFGKKRFVELTDGGALSNSGMWSLFKLLTSDKTRSELERRGVLLIVVEASKMPEYPSFTGSERSLMGTIGDQSPIGQFLHRSMFNLLEREYGERIAIVQVDLIPLERYNVFTTWALDGNTRDRLEEAFDTRWREVRPLLVDRWKHLRSLPPPALPPAMCQPYLPSRADGLVDRDRPPLD